MVKKNLKNFIKRKENLPIILMITNNKLLKYICVLTFINLTINIAATESANKTTPEIKKGYEYFLKLYPEFIISLKKYGITKENFITMECHSSFCKCQGSEPIYFWNVKYMEKDEIESKIFQFTQFY